MSIQTVLGPIACENLGITLMHEHTFVDAWEWGGRLDYNSTVDDQELLVEELEYYRRAGGASLVDLTSGGLGRNPVGLQRLSAATGLHIVMGAGWYRERVYPPCVMELSTNHLAEMVIKEFRGGTDGTEVRPGVIGEIGTERFYITPAEERVFRACARAQLETGAAIATHTTHFGDLALEQITILTEEGVQPDRIIIGHLGERRDAKDVLAVAAKGVYVSIDHVGRPASAGTQPELQRAQNVFETVRAGYLDRVLISMDICANSLMHWNGGHGYDYLLLKFLPMLTDLGLTRKEIQTILVENPQRVLDFSI